MATISTGTQTDISELRFSNTGPQSYPPITSGHFGGRQKYADSKDLPSYPSLGLKKDDAAASAAASLGWANARSAPPCPTEMNLSAHQAATFANDLKMGTTRPPENSTPGSTAAAAMAVENAKRIEKRASMPVSGWGSSAANKAFASAGTDHSSPRKQMTGLDRQRSLRAARGAMAGSARPRSNSSPLAYPDSANAAANALNAAMTAHRPSLKIKIDEAGASPITSMSREMYTSHPPLKQEVDERNREAVLHASAVAMAKRMYTQQQRTIDSEKQAQGQQEAGSRPRSAGTEGLSEPIQFPNLQEAAYKLAQEKLAHLHDDPHLNRDLAEYYGTYPTAPSTPARRLTKLDRLRRRSSSDGDAMVYRRGDDHTRSRQIRKQMSLFSTRVDEVDETQRARDREALLATAQRNVKAKLEGMDEKIYKEQGRVAPAKLNEWELKAHAAAQARSDVRMGERTDQVDLGAGKYMDRDKVEEIATKRVQPVLDEINEKAEAERMRIVTLKEEQEREKLKCEAEKAKNAEVMENLRQLKEEERNRSRQLKEEAKAKEKEEKALKAEEKRLAKEGRLLDEDIGHEHSEKSPEETVTTHRHRLPLPFTPKIQTKNATAYSYKNETSPLSPPANSPESANESAGSRVKNWLKSRLHKPRAKSISALKGGKSDKVPGGFIGGHALTRLHADGTGSMSSLSDGNRSASMREVALAGRPVSSILLRRPGEDLGGGAISSSSTGTTTHRFGRVISHEENDSMSSVSSEDAGPSRESRRRTRARPAPLEFDNAIAPPRTLVDPARITPRSSGSPSRDSKFIEII